MKHVVVVGFFVGLTISTIGQALFFRMWVAAILALIAGLVVIYVGFLAG